MMNKNIICLSVLSMLVGCGGSSSSSSSISSSSSSSSSSDIVAAAFNLPNPRIGVDSSDPVGIWVGVGSVKGSSLLENANEDNKQNSDDYNQNYDFNSEEKIYFAIRRDDETGQIVAPCGGVGDLLDDGNGKLMFSQSSYNLNSQYRRTKESYTGIEISEDGRMTLEINYESSEVGVGWGMKDYRYDYESEKAFTAVKVSDSTSFQDLYEFSFRTTDGVDSFTDDAGAGDKDLLCASIGKGSAKGTKNKEPYDVRTEGVNVRYNRAQVFIFRQQGTENELIQYSDLDEVVYNPVVNCDETNCGPIFDVQASKDALILSSTNENIITELTIKTSE
jgi:hypothetical protein